MKFTRARSRVARSSRPSAALPSDADPALRRAVERLTADGWLLRSATPMAAQLTKTRSGPYLFALLVAWLVTMVASGDSSAPSKRDVQRVMDLRVDRAGRIWQQRSRLARAFGRRERPFPSE